SAVTTMPAATRRADGGASPTRSTRIATATGSGRAVRWRNSQPPSWIVVSGSICTDSGQFDRVRDVGKIRTTSVVYPHAFIRHLIDSESGPRFLRPRHDRAHAARTAAPVRAGDAGRRAVRESRMADPGGSVKDRAAARMILDGEASGQLTAGRTILDAT